MGKVEDANFVDKVILLPQQLVIFLYPSLFFVPLSLVLYSNLELSTLKNNMKIMHLVWY